MAGPALLEGVLNFQPRRITKVGERSNPVFRSFIASFDVAFYNVPFHSGVAHLLFLKQTFGWFVGVDYLCKCIVY